MPRVRAIVLRSLRSIETPSRIWHISLYSSEKPLAAAHSGRKVHVFIDTNILLNFFHYSKDELDALNDVFGSHEQGAATVYLTEQVRNEFVRNREAKIKDAIKKFESTRFAQQFPYFMKDYEEYSDIRARAAELEELRTAILAKVQADVAAHNLVADKLIHQIFETSPIVSVHGRSMKAHVCAWPWGIRLAKTSRWEIPLTG